MLHLAASLVTFYFLHSLLAAEGMKRCAASRLGLVRWYRMSYNLVSLALLGWVVWAYLRVPSSPMVSLPAGFQWVGMALIIAGAAVSTAAVLRFGASGFAGLRPEVDTGLVRRGLHAHVRHPIYSGLIIASLGWMLVTPDPPTLLCVSITFLYLPVGIRLEEAKLILRHGDAYRTYRREVPPLWP